MEVHADENGFAVLLCEVLPQDVSFSAIDGHPCPNYWLRLKYRVGDFPMAIVSASSNNPISCSSPARARRVCLCASSHFPSSQRSGRKCDLNFLFARSAARYMN